MPRLISLVHDQGVVAHRGVEVGEVAQRLDRRPGHERQVGEREPLLGPEPLADGAAHPLDVLEVDLVGDEGVGRRRLGPHHVLGRPAPDVGERHHPVAGRRPDRGVARRRPDGARTGATGPAADRRRRRAVAAAGAAAGGGDGGGGWPAAGGGVAAGGGGGGLGASWRSGAAGGPAPVVARRGAPAVDHRQHVLAGDPPAEPGADHVCRIDAVVGEQPAHHRREHPCPAAVPPVATGHASGSAVSPPGRRNRRGGGRRGGGGAGGGGGAACWAGAAGGGGGGAASGRRGRWWWRGLLGRPGAGRGVAGGAGREPGRESGRRAGAAASGSACGGAGGGICPPHTVADDGQPGADLHRLALGHQDLAQAAGGRRRDLGVHLVGRHLEERLVPVRPARRPPSSSG